jgi:hypothetical protein
VEPGAWEQVNASDWEVWEIEQSGSTEATWLLEPSTGERWLHKDTKIPSNGVEQGEDWSEVVSTQVAHRLGVPCAPTRLCIRAGRRGSLSRSILPKGHDLWEGAVVLETAGVPGFFRQIEGGPPAEDPQRPGVRRPGHSLNNIKAALAGVVPPPGFEGPDGLTAFDVFAGYMVLDALIANPDRHEQNWARLTPRLQTLPEALSPSYDHASSLGHNLQDPGRQRCLGDPARLEKWATKGRAGRFEHLPPAPTLAEHAANAVEMCTDEGAHWLRQQLHTLDLAPVLEALNRCDVPEMSEDAARESLIFSAARAACVAGWGHSAGNNDWCAI